MLAKSLTIAIRYSFVRSQFKNQKGPDGQIVQRKLMDYQTHRYKLMTNLASLFVMILTFREMERLYEKMIQKIQ